eukprot:31540-Pelagococcus_subviridis.AAC.3
MFFAWSAATAAARSAAMFAATSSVTLPMGSPHSAGDASLEFVECLETSWTFTVARWSSSSSSSAAREDNEGTAAVISFAFAFAAALASYLNAAVCPGADIPTGAWPASVSSSSSSSSASAASPGTEAVTPSSCIPSSPPSSSSTSSSSSSSSKPPLSVIVGVVVRSFPAAFIASRYCDGSIVTLRGKFFENTFPMSTDPGPLFGVGAPPPPPFADIGVAFATFGVSPRSNAPTVPVPCDVASDGRPPPPPARFPVRLRLDPGVDITPWLNAIVPSSDGVAWDLDPPDAAGETPNARNGSVAVGVTCGAGVGVGVGVGAGAGDGATTIGAGGGHDASVATGFALELAAVAVTGSGNATASSPEPSAPSSFANSRTDSNAVSTANETRRFAKDWRRFFNAARAFGDAFAPASAPVALETSLRMLRRRRLRIWGMGGGEEEGRRRRRARRQI